VQPDRKRFHQRAIFQRQIRRQLGAGGLLRAQILRITTLSRRALRAPLGLSARTGRTGAAGGGGHRRHPVADANALDPAADGDHFACVLVAEHLAGRRLERSMAVGQMQVATANSAAADLQHDLAGSGLGIGQGLNLQRNPGSFEHCRAHARSLLEAFDFRPPRLRDAGAPLEQR